MFLINKLGIIKENKKIIEMQQIAINVCKNGK